MGDVHRCLGNPAVAFRALWRGPEPRYDPTESLVERFATLTIIVLGEVMFGVVEGLSQSTRDVTTIATGMIALTVGFGFWWIYFDVVGGKLPKPDGRAWPTGC